MNRDFWPAVGKIERVVLSVAQSYDRLRPTILGKMLILIYKNKINNDFYYRLCTTCYYLENYLQFDVSLFAYCDLAPEIGVFLMS